MKKHLILLCLFIFNGAFGYTVSDGKCVKDCKESGYSLSYCDSKCQYDPNPQYTQYSRSVNNTDYRCMNDCQSRYSYSLCKSKCSY